MCRKKFIAGLTSIVGARALIGIFLLTAVMTDLCAQKPKIVIGLVVDQMRWDYLYRYRDRYGKGGFNRIMGEGFSCDNTLINYSPTVTACGHTCIYTGSVPALTGIMGNDWYDRYNGKIIYCTDDSTVTPIGTDRGGKMSPRNLLTTTIGDELRMADNFKSKVIGIALKDRAAILPAGHTANGAFWFDSETSRFVTSSYYMNELPSWVQRFNDKKNMDSYVNRDWETLYPIGTYTKSTSDDKTYEEVSGREKRAVFPHRSGAVRATPFGDGLTLNFAKAAMEAYGLGLGDATDFLTISLSSPDGVGHQYGPNSIEIEDTYLRLDQDLAGFFQWLDNRFGKNNYLFFLTADHGVASSPGYSIENEMPGGAFDLSNIGKRLNEALRERFQIDNAIESITELQIYINRELLAAHEINKNTVENYIADWMIRQPGIARVLSMESLESAVLPSPIKVMMVNGYNAARSGDMAIIPLPGWKAGSIQGADHGLIYAYDTHIPLLWMGWKIPHGSTNRLVGMTDIAPTLASLLHIQMPSGCIGQPVVEIAGK